MNETKNRFCSGLLSVDCQPKQYLFKTANLPFSVRAKMCDAALRAVTVTKTFGHRPGNYRQNSIFYSIFAETQTRQPFERQTINRIFMIAYIEGRLTHKEPSYVIIDVNGVGYEIRISLQTYGNLPEGEKCRLHTHFHVREDAQLLYGFSDRAEKRIFLDLTSVSGIGTNTALMMLSSLSPSEIQQAIVSEDLRTIQGIKGIGVKTAQRVILELRDKMKKEMFLTSGTSAPPVTSHNTVRNEALSALTTLGIARNVAEKSIDTVLKREGDGLSLEQIIRMALKVS